MLIYISGVAPEDYQIKRPGSERVRVFSRGNADEKRIKY